METILITGGTASGKTIIAEGLMKEHKARGFTSICFECVSPKDDIEEKVRERYSDPKGLTLNDSCVDFCILTSLEPPEEFNRRFYRVIRTGRS